LDKTRLVGVLAAAKQLSCLRASRVSSYNPLPARLTKLALYKQAFYDTLRQSKVTEQRQWLTLTV
jgi:hypothetical protein